MPNKELKITEGIANRERKQMQQERLSLALLGSHWHCRSHGVSLWPPEDRVITNQVIGLKLSATRLLCCFYDNPLARPTSTIGLLSLTAPAGTSGSLPYHTKISVESQCQLSSLYLVYVTALGFHCAFTILCWCRATLWGHVLHILKWSVDPSLLYFQLALQSI